MAMMERMSNTYALLVEKWAVMLNSVVEKVPFRYTEPLPAGLLKAHTSGKGAIKLSLKAAAGELVPTGHCQVMEYAQHQEALWWNGRVTHLEAYLWSLVVKGAEAPTGVGWKCPTLQEDKEMHQLRCGIGWVPLAAYVVDLVCKQHELEGIPFDLLALQVPHFKEMQNVVQAWTRAELEAAGEPVVTKNHDKSRWPSREKCA